MEPPRAPTCYVRLDSIYIEYCVYGLGPWSNLLPAGRSEHTVSHAPHACSHFARFARIIPHAFASLLARASLARASIQFNSISKSHGTMTHHGERALKHLAQQSRAIRTPPTNQRNSVHYNRRRLGIGASSDECVLPRSPGPRPSAAGSRTHPRIGRPAMRPDSAGGRRAPARAVSIPPYAISRCAACSTARRARPVRMCSAARSRVRGDTTAAARCGRRRSGDTTGTAGTCSAGACSWPASSTSTPAGRPRLKSELTAHRPQTPPLYNATKLFARRLGRLSSYGTGALGLSVPEGVVCLTAYGAMEASPAGRASPPARRLYVEMSRF